MITDTPELVNAYRLLSLRASLKLEVIGLYHSRGIRASVIVREELKKAGVKPPRKLPELHHAFQSHLRSLGILNPQ